jgi:prepilin-type N-terminal cleavage/methylation domain-containing protein/prepilin-type processing-associated H-X9-DG protein
MPRRTRHLAAFTLVELLVVIGIISILIAILLPAVQRSLKQAKKVQCEANLRSIGQLLYIYAANNEGVVYPVGSLNPFTKTYRTLGNQDRRDDGTPLPKEERWPAYVFDPPIWNPKVMICPDDTEVLDSPTGEQHSYLLNHHLEESPDHFLKLGGHIEGWSPSTIVLMGEKKTQEGDYYMSSGEFGPPREVVESYRHGATLGSNYLWMDGHVSTEPPQIAQNAVDPWQPVPDPTPVQ